MIKGQKMCSSLPTDSNNVIFIAVAVYIVKFSIFTGSLLGFFESKQDYRTFTGFLCEIANLSGKHPEKILFIIIWNAFFFFERYWNQSDCILAVSFVFVSCGQSKPNATHCLLAVIHLKVSLQWSLAVILLNKNTVSSENLVLVTYNSFIFPKSISTPGTEGFWLHYSTDASLRLIDGNIILWCCFHPSRNTVYQCNSPPAMAPAFISMVAQCHFNSTYSVSLRPREILLFHYMNKSCCAALI